MLLHSLGYLFAALVIAAVTLIPRLKKELVDSEPTQVPTTELNGPVSFAVIFRERTIWTLMAI
jgi:hypothetical protein